MSSLVLYIEGSVELNTRTELGNLLQTVVGFKFACFFSSLSEALHTYFMV